MFEISRLAVALWFVSFAFIHSGGAAEVTVDLQLVAGPGAPVIALQQWTQNLSKLPDVNLRAGGTLRATQPSLNRNENRLRIVGIINSQNELVLPSRRFGLRDISELAKWIEQQRAYDPRQSKLATGRFGMQPDRLQALHDELKTVTNLSTKGRRADECFEAVASQLSVRIKISSGDRSKLRDVEIPSELKPLSAGTQLAIVLHHAELQCVPQTTGITTELLVTDESVDAESWPIGWDPPRPARKTLPQLFTFLDIEINNTAISAVMDVISQRLGVPILYDRPRLAVKGLDPEKIEVSFPAGNTFYAKLLDRTLFDARLKHDLRTDERGQPFLWITPLFQK